jgi:hypothetical protein
MESRINNSKVFKEAVNYRLKGTTFDAKHLDNLINLGLGSSSLNKYALFTKIKQRDTERTKSEIRKQTHSNVRYDHISDL